MYVWYPLLLSKAVRGGMEATLVQRFGGHDAMNWLGPGRDVGQDARLCIHPSPFGAQCTMHSRDSLRSCLMLKGCNSFTCPSPEVYERGHRRDKITSRVCQARSSFSYEQWHSGTRLAASHGMCSPTGCENFFLFPARVKAGLDAAWQAEMPPQSRIILVPASVPASVSTTWLGLPPALGLLNMSNVALSGETRRATRDLTRAETTLRVFLLRDAAVVQQRARRLGTHARTTK